MSRADIINLLPGILLVGASLVTMVLIAINRNHVLTFTVSVRSLSEILYYLLVYASGREYSIKPLLVVDGFGVFVIALLVLNTLAVLMCSYPYFEQREER